MSENTNKCLSQLLTPKVVSVYNLLCQHSEIPKYSVYSDIFDTRKTGTREQLVFLLCPAWWPHLQAFGGDLRAARDQGEGGGRKAPPTPHGAHQSGAGSGKDCLLLLSFLHTVRFQ